MFSPILEWKEKLSLDVPRGMNVPCTWVRDYPAAVSHTTEGEPQGMSRVERERGGDEESRGVGQPVVREILFEQMFSVTSQPRILVQLLG